MPIAAYIDVDGDLGGGVREEEVRKQLGYTRVAAALPGRPRPGGGKCRMMEGKRVREHEGCNFVASHMLLLLRLIIISC